MQLEQIRVINQSKDEWWSEYERTERIVNRGESFIDDVPDKPEWLVKRVINGYKKASNDERLIKKGTN